MKYFSAFDIIKHAKEQNKKISNIILEAECHLQDKTVQEIRDKINKFYETMKESSLAALSKPIYSMSGLSGGDAMKMVKYVENNKPFCGETVTLAIARAISCSEVNASMGKIVAFPTAGACGILPGALFTAAESVNASKDRVIESILIASGVGCIIESKATLAGAEGGCQAECGSSAAMTAAAVVGLVTDDLEMPFEAAALALKNILGLVCDPVAGLVEIPCIKRNGVLAANALACADMALAGIKSAIPFDEVVEVMFKVGKSIPMELRETSLGGLATSPTGKKLKEMVFKQH